MNADRNITVKGAKSEAGNPRLLTRGFEGLNPYLKKSLELRQALEQVAALFRRKADSGVLDFGTQRANAALFYLAHGR